MDACKSLGRLVIYGTVFICLHKLFCVLVDFHLVHLHNFIREAAILNSQAVNFTIKYRSRRRNIVCFVYRRGRNCRGVVNDG